MHTTQAPSGSPAAPDALISELRDVAQARRTLDLRAARLIEQIERFGGLKRAGCSSIGQLGERVGISGRDAFVLRGLGITLREVPESEALVAAGIVTVGAAACLAEVVGDPQLRRADDDWLGWASREPLPVLRRRVKQRVEEGRAHGEPVACVTFFVKESVRDDFSRARVIASRKEGRALTEGETLGAVTRHYLDTFDEERVTPAARRLPHTAYVDSRYVPAEVRRQVRQRQQGRCAVPFCPFDTFLEFAHVVPHRAGGSREANNLVMLCWTHHRMLDEGRLRMEGTAAAPIFCDTFGERLDQRVSAVDGAATVAKPPPLDAGTAECAGQRARESRGPPGGGASRGTPVPQALEPPEVP